MKIIEERKKETRILEAAIHKIVEDVQKSENGTVFQELPHEWNFCPDTGNIGVKENWYDGNFPTQCSSICKDDPLEAEDGHCTHDEKGWYMITFVPNTFNSTDQVFIRFNKIWDRCKIWVNGQLAGERMEETYYTMQIPFALNVTGMLRPAVENSIIVQVQHTLARNGQMGKTELIKVSR